MMDYLGSCRCKLWSVRVSMAERLSDLHPRVCDCNYCQAHPSHILSTPSMQIALSGDRDQLLIDKNGEQLANFYRCKSCGDVLAIGCVIDGELRGAANALLLDEQHLLGERVNIQPRLLARADKLERWTKIWGRLLLS